MMSDSNEPTATHTDLDISLPLKPPNSGLENKSARVEPLTQHMQRLVLNMSYQEVTQAVLDLVKITMENGIVGCVDTNDGLKNYNELFTTAADDLQEWAQMSLPSS